MITDAIIEFFLAPFRELLSEFPLPDVPNLVIPDNAYDTILSVLEPLGYFLPTDTMISCLLVSLAIDNFHIVWALILRLKSFFSVHFLV